MSKEMIKKDKKIKNVNKIDKDKEAKKSISPVKFVSQASNKVKYFEANGRRKTATARVRLFARSKTSKEELFIINEKPLKEYFPIFEFQEIIFSPFKEANCLDQFKFSAMVRGGGVSSQAGAVRHGIAKALILYNPDLRKKLKKNGFLTRDSRMRERKKFGLRRARRAPQWSKR